MSIDRALENGLVAMAAVPCALSIAHRCSFGVSFISSYFGLMFQIIAVSFSDLGHNSEIVNCIGLFIDQSPDRDHWCVSCIVWYRVLIHRAWLLDSPEGSFTVTLL